MLAVDDSFTRSQVNGAPPATDAAPIGLAVVNAAGSAAETIGAVEGAITGNEALRQVALVDHGANAEAVGETLRPTRLILFGNPSLGTPLMRENRLAGLDLPQKMLVVEDDEGGVSISYDDPAWLAERHGIEDRDDVIETLSTALAGLAARAAGTADGTEAPGDG